MSAYCQIAPGRPLHDAYHATEYGFPQRDETVLFERLGLEIMQAGLSWDLVLRRRAGMAAALHGWSVDRVAAMDERDVERLLADPAMIRNRLKVLAIIDNAGRVRAMRDSHGGFANWIEAHRADETGSPRDRAAWIKLFRRTLRFMGPEVVGEFLLSIGVLPGAHAPDCPIFAQIERLAT